MNVCINRLPKVAIALFFIAVCVRPAHVAEAAPKVDDAIVIKFKDAAFESTNTFKLKPEVAKKIKILAPVAKLRPIIDVKALGKLQSATTNTGFTKDLKRAKIPVRNYFTLEGEFEDHRTNVVAQLKAQVQEIEIAYPAPAVSNPSGQPRLPTGTLFPAQSYLYKAPAGVGARDAWVASAFTGACGEGMHMTDLEMGWSLKHNAYKVHGPLLISGQNLKEWMWHGSSVLGVICGKDHAILGIAPHIASVKVISHSGRSSRIADAILEAAEELRKRQPEGVGGVLVIEAQLNPYGDGTYQPVEVEDYIYAAILEAVDKGVVVIEAAGNGNFHLDRLPTLNRCAGGAPFRDSGAILVGGGSPTAAGWQRWSQSNYGSRIDCFASAHNVVTARFPNESTYWETFNGTSSATAIIAGVALSTQGIQRKKHTIPMDGVRLRSVLTNLVHLPTVSIEGPAVNCSAGEGAIGEWIGVMPNLVALERDL